MQRSALAVVGHFGPSARGEKMSAPQALAAMAALGQPLRLDVFRLLMRREPKGLAAGMIAEKIGCPANTLSTHLAILARCGLLRAARDGKSIIYRADIDGLKALVRFLVTDCCEGRPELCNLRDAIRNPTCTPTRKRRNRRNEPG
jgi:ArsR family transcriptional regulator